MDLVEQVSPGPYLELFARRDRLGWDTWGNESLGTAEMVRAKRPCGRCGKARELDEASGWCAECLWGPLPELPRPV